MLINERQRPISPEQRTAKIEAVLADTTLVGEARLRQITGVTRSGGILSEKSIDESRTLIEQDRLGKDVDAQALLDAKVRDALYQNLTDSQQTQIEEGVSVVLIDMMGNRAVMPANKSENV